MSSVGSQTENQSSVLQKAPILSRRGLTVLLALMCLVPVLTILALQLTMPPVHTGKLHAEVALRNVPPQVYYDLDADQRVPFPTASLVVKNRGNETWTHLNIRINRHYQIYEHKYPIEPGQERGFLLDRFVSRTGAVFDVRLVQPKNVEIYARLPDKSRATHVEDF